MAVTFLELLDMECLRCSSAFPWWTVFTVFAFAQTVFGVVSFFFFNTLLAVWSVVVAVWGIHTWLRRHRSDLWSLDIGLLVLIGLFTVYMVLGMLPDTFSVGMAIGQLALAGFWLIYGTCLGFFGPTLKSTVTARQHLKKFFALFGLSAGEQRKPIIGAKGDTRGATFDNLYPDDMASTERGLTPTEPPLTKEAQFGAARVARGPSQISTAAGDVPQLGKTGTLLTQGSVTGGVESTQASPRLEPPSALDTARAKAVKGEPISKRVGSFARSLSLLFARGKKQEAPETEKPHVDVGDLEAAPAAAAAAAVPLEETKIEQPATEEAPQEGAATEAEDVKKATAEGEGGVELPSEEQIEMQVQGVIEQALEELVEPTKHEEEAAREAAVVTSEVEVEVAAFEQEAPPLLPPAEGEGERQIPTDEEQKPEQQPEETVSPPAPPAGAMWFGAACTRVGSAPARRASPAPPSPPPAHRLPSSTVRRARSRSPTQTSPCPPPHDRWPSHSSSSSSSSVRATLSIAGAPWTCVACRRRLRGRGWSPGR